MKSIVFTGGGTGGHIYPGLAVVEELRSLMPDSSEFKIIWIGNNRGMDRSLVEKSGLVDEFAGIPCGKLRRYFSLQNFFDCFKILAGFVCAYFKLLKIRPKAVFSKGGFVSVPPCYAAKLLRIPVFTHECDFTTGLATRLNTRVAKTLFVSYSETKERLSPAVREKTVVSGNPVRPSFFNADKKAGWKFVSGDDFLPKKNVLLVVGGSLGARQINDLVFENIDWLCDNFIVIHQTGSQEGLTMPMHGDYYPFEFIYSQMCDVMALCDIIFSRAGANFLWEAAVQNKPMLLLPLSGSGSRGDQVDNAEYFEKKGCAFVLHDKNADSENLKKMLSEMKSEELRQRMSNAAKALAGEKRSSLLIAEKILDYVK